MKCVLCNEDNQEFLWKNLEKESARHAKQPLDVQICKSCGLVSLDMTSIPPQQVQEYYETTNTFEVPGELPEGHKAMRIDQVQWVLDNLPDEHGAETVLDIGCGAGFVLKTFKENGFKPMGTDLSPAMIRNLKNLYGIDGVQGPFSHDLIGGEKFDLVSSTCVLEHMLNPKENVSEMARSINEGGYLFLEVPDAEHPRWDTIVDHLAYDHIWHFTERTLGRLMEDCGFEIIAVKHLENGPDSGNPEAVLRMLGVYRADKRFKRTYLVNDYENEKAILAKYKEKHASYIAAFQKKIDGIAEKIGSEPVAIFCGGEHTATLLKRVDISKLNVVCIYDNDQAVVGKTLNGLEIRSGSQASVDDTGVKHFILSTTNHEKAISATLKRRNPEVATYGLYTQLD